MSAAVEELVDSLLYEGYALYPYTPGATKNATPTPFGIVYPPAYAERNPSTCDQLRIQCSARGRGRAVGVRCASCRPRASATRASSGGSSWPPRGARSSSSARCAAARRCAWRSARTGAGW